MRFQEIISMDVTGNSQEISSESNILCSRSLLIELKDGTLIEGICYDAISGCFYGSYGAVSEPLSEEAVLQLNEIFGIE